MTIKSCRIIIVLLVLPFLPSGCWSRRELNELSIASAIGFDKHGDGYEVSVQLINPTEIASKRGEAGGGRMSVITEKLSGETIFEIMRKMATTAPHRIYLAHLRILVIGEELAREGMADVLDYVSRNRELRTDLFILIAKNHRASEVLEVLTPLEKTPSNRLYSSMVAIRSYWGGTAETDLHLLIYNLVTSGSDPALAAVRIIGNPGVGESRTNLNAVVPPVRLQYQGIAIFHGDKLAGWLTTEESQGYNFAVGKMKSTVVNILCGDKGSYGIEVVRTERKVEASMENGKPVIHLEIFVEGNIGEVQCSVSIESSGAIKEMEKATSGKIKETVERAIQKSERYRADIFGFGRAVEMAYPHEWQNLKKNWHEHFAELPVRVEVKMKIRRSGSVVDSFLERMNGDK